MGKTERPRRPRGDLSSPYLSTTRHPLEDSLIPKNPIPLLEQLDDPSGKERKKACNLLALAVFDPSAASMIISNNGVQKLLHRVGDNTYPVVASALTVLRNLVITRDRSVLDTLSQEHHLTTLLHPYKKVMPLLENPSEREHAIAILCHTIGIYWNLSIEKESVLDFVLKSGILESLINFLDIQKYPVELSTTAAHMLSVLTDEYQRGIEAVKAVPNGTAILTQLAGVKATANSGCMPIIPVLCGVVLYNLRDNETLFAILQQILPSIRFSLNELNPNQRIFNHAKRIHEEGEALASDTSFPLEIEFTKNSVESQIAGLELLANICCLEGEESDRMEDYSPSMMKPIREFCSSLSLQCLLLMCQPFDSEVNKILQENPHVFSEMVDFLNDRTLRSLAFLANYFSTTNHTDLSMSSGDVFKELGGLFVKFSQRSEDVKFLEGIVSAMRAFVCNSESYEYIGQEELQGIAALCGNIFSPELRRCGISMLASITSSKVFTTNPAFYESTGTILVKSLGDESIVVVNEGLNGIFDIFGEDDTHPVCQSLGVVKALQNIVPSFKSRTSLLPSTTDPEFLSMLGETLENVEGFIQYKMSQ